MAHHAKSIEHAQSRTCSREEVVAIFVERQRHDAVRQIERLLHAVPMVDVDINVQHAWVVSEEHSRTTYIRYKNITSVVKMTGGLALHPLGVLD